MEDAVFIEHFLYVNKEMMLLVGAVKTHTHTHTHTHYILPFGEPAQAVPEGGGTLPIWLIQECGESIMLCLLQGAWKGEGEKQKGKEMSRAWIMKKNR